MARHEEQPTSAIEHVLKILRDQGLGAIAQAMQTLLNDAMELERTRKLPHSVDSVGLDSPAANGRGHEEVEVH